MDVEYAKKILEETKKNYDLISEDFSRTRDRVWEEMRFLDKYVNDNERVLDVGCGNGRLYELFQDKTLDYYGVDFSEKLIEIARKRFPQFKFQTADALNLPFPPDFFDKVFSIAVLHHIPSRVLRIKFLREIKRTLKPDGLLVLSVWNFSNFKRICLSLKFPMLKILRKTKLESGDAFVPWGKKLSRYVHAFSERELKDIIKEAGFDLKGERVLKRPKSKESNILVFAKKAL